MGKMIIMSKNILTFLFLMSVLAFCITCKKLEKEMMVKTGAAKNISFTSAEVSGEIVDIGNGISQYGHCYGLSPDVDIHKNPKTAFGTTSKTTSFTSILNDLQPGRKYYTKSYISNGSEIIYGDVVSFNTVSVSQPTVVTAMVQEITQRTVIAGGEVTAGAEPPVIDRGVCWNTTGEPDINDNKMSSGQGGPGIFEITIHDLTANTDYFIRAYASTNLDIYYGEPIPFKTAPVVLPILTTIEAPPELITDKSAVSGGNITFDGGGDILEKGVCWSSTGIPTISDFKTVHGPGQPYYFESVLTGLKSNFIYRVHAYATNLAGTAYGNVIEFMTDFICGTTLTDQRDGKTYLTKQYGEQCWMTANLNIGVRKNGSVNQTNDGIIEKYCYDNNEVNCNIYGGLYQWDELMQYSTEASPPGICPEGWHIPSDPEWKAFEIWLGMTPEQADGLQWRGTDEGGKLKAAGTTYWLTPNTGATNSTLFTALPSGNRTGSGTFDGLGYMTDYWTSTLIIDTHCFYRMLNYDQSKIYRIDGNKSYATPVRCIKNQ